jgi:hypothetical protein
MVELTLLLCLTKRDYFDLDRSADRNDLSRTLSALVGQLFSYCESRKDKDDEEAIIGNPVQVTPSQIETHSEEWFYTENG